MWLGSPSTAQAATSPPTAKSTSSSPAAWRAKYPRRPRRGTSARAPTLALAHKDPDIGSGRASRTPARHPTPARGSVVGRPAAPRAEGGAGTSRADALLVWGCGISLRNCSDVKSRVSCTSTTREGRACRGRALRRPRPTPHPRPGHTSSHPRPGARSTRAAPGAWCPNGPPRWAHNGPARDVPAPPSARGVHSLPPHASTPCASRVPRPIKQGESGVSGGVCATCIFGDLSE